MQVQSKLAFNALTLQAAQLEGHLANKKSVTIIQKFLYLNQKGHLNKKLKAAAITIIHKLVPICTVCQWLSEKSD